VWEALRKEHRNNGAHHKPTACQRVRCSQKNVTNFWLVSCWIAGRLAIMNTPVPHRITDLRATVQRLEYELAEDEIDRGSCQQLCASITNQLDCIDRQISIDRAEESTQEKSPYVDFSGS
jgi:hypothetical protein